MDNLIPFFISLLHKLQFCSNVASFCDLGPHIAGKTIRAVVAAL